MVKSILIAPLLVLTGLLAGCSDWSSEVDGNYPEPHPEPVEQEYEEPENEMPEWVQEDAGSAATSCRDVTSYDDDWSNDMLCTRPDGSQFYTDYEGAARYQ